MKTPQNTLLLQAIGDCIDLVRKDMEHEQEKRIGGSKYAEDGSLRSMAGRRKHKFSWKLFKEEVFGLKSAQQKDQETYYVKFDDILNLDSSDEDEDEAEEEGGFSDDITVYTRSTASMRSRISAYSNVTDRDLRRVSKPVADFEIDNSKPKGKDSNERDSNLEWLFQG